MGGDSIQEGIHQPNHQVLRLDKLVTVQGEYVRTLAAIVKGSPKLVLSTQSQSGPNVMSFKTFKDIAAVKFNTHMFQDVILSAEDEEDWHKVYARVLEGTADAEVTLEVNVIQYIGSLWVLDSVDLRNINLPREHPSILVGHISQEKTIQLVRRDFFWLQMNQWMEDCIHSCPHCQNNKAARHTDYRLV
jgi:hypothetical protein